MEFQVGKVIGKALSQGLKSFSKVENVMVMFNG